MISVYVFVYACVLYINMKYKTRSKYMVIDLKHYVWLIIIYKVRSASARATSAILL